MTEVQHCEWDTERVPTGDVTSRGLRDTATPYLSVGLQPVSLMCVGGSLNLKGEAPSYTLFCPSLSIWSF